MIELTVADVSVDDARTLEPETPAAEAAEALRDPDVPALVVCEGETVVGVVTDSDFVALVAEGPADPTVERIMSSPAVTVPPGIPIEAAARRMREAGVRRLPVVEDGACRGIVSTATLSPYLPPYRLEIDRRREPARLTTDGDASADERITPRATPKP